MTTLDYLKAGTNAKRFVVEDSITKVTSDGEPHEMMTMIAVISGLIAAVVILTILMSLIGCRKAKQDERDSGAASSTGGNSIRSVSDAGTKHSSILTIYQPSRSSLSLASTSLASTPDIPLNECHCNAGFVGSELNLHAASIRRSGRKKKRAHWQDEIVLANADDKDKTLRTVAVGIDVPKVNDTKLEIERF